MLELTVLALINQLANVGFGPLVATGVMAADPSSVRALVTDTATEDRVIARVPALARPGVQLLPTRSLRLVEVDIRIRGRDAVRLTWSLTPRRGTTEVDAAHGVLMGSSRGRSGTSVAGAPPRRALRERAARAGGHRFD